MVILKICILSMQRVKNFGSLLQSYALKKVIEDNGHQVSFLDIEQIEEDSRLLTGEGHVFPDEECGTGVLSKLKKLDRYTVNRLRIKAKNKQQTNLMEAFRVSSLGMGADGNKGHYDCCVIGSDEVFNCMTKSSWGFTSQLFGNVRQADRVITYAASCGATVLEEIPAAVVNRIREAFGNVSAFSVRDDNTRSMVSALTDKQVDEHLDPVLIGDFTEELRRTKLPENLPERYCVVYSYYNRIHKKEEIRAIQEFCRKHQLEIVTVGSPQMWEKRHLVLTPFEVLRVFENASFVITDTFHGTIFSAKYTDHFATITRESNKNKLEDLIERLGVQQHRVTSFDQLETAYAVRNNKERIAQLCSRERDRSIRYLQENL